MSGSGLEKVSRSSIQVDYVIHYSFENTDKSQAEAQFVKLVEVLNAAGFAVQVRNGDQYSLLIFIRIASEDLLREKVYQLRVQDWLYGIRTVAPPIEMRLNLEKKPIMEAERLRFVYSLITCPRSEGGAGITPNSGEWSDIKSIFPLHDLAFNKAWVRKLSSKYFLDTEDLDEIRGKFGEKIALYFAFLQTYVLFLTFPAGFGFFAWLLLDQYSPIYATINALWCVFLLEYWKKKEEDLSIRWGVKGVFLIDQKRTEFRHESVLKDPVTVDDVKVYPPLKRLFQQLLQVPFAMAVTILMGSLIAICFSIEIFMSEVYNGPFKGYLVFIPTLILSTVMPAFSKLFTSTASKLTYLENHETMHSHEASMVRKIFVMNFISSYFPIFLTAFVYVPFAQVIVPYLAVFQLVVSPFVGKEKQTTAQNSGFQINPDRLRKQIIYFTFTAQIIGFGFEVIVPYVQRKVFNKFKKVIVDRASKDGNRNSSEEDSPEESEFLERARIEAHSEIYDVTTDFREMVVQFGYMSLFSVIWPLTAGSFFINNWIEIRGDALKIALETQRPKPWRADSIGPWIDAMAFLTWLGNLTSAVLVYLFNAGEPRPDGKPRNIEGWGLFVTIFLSEHIYLAIQLGIRKIMIQFQSSRQQIERFETLIVRKHYLDKRINQEAVDETIMEGKHQYENTCQGTSESNGENKLGKCRISDHRFWRRTQAEIICAGKAHIGKAALSELKKEI